MVICLERSADLHMAQLMPLLLTVSCFSKIQIGFTFLVPAHPGSPGKRAVKRVCVCVCVCVRACVRAYVCVCVFSRYKYYSNAIRNVKLMPVMTKLRTFLACIRGMRRVICMLCKKNKSTLDLNAQSRSI